MCAVAADCNSFPLLHCLQCSLSSSSQSCCTFASFGKHLLPLHFPYEASQTLQPQILSLTLQFLKKQKRSVCCLCLSVSSILLASHLQQKFWHIIMCITHTHTHTFHYFKGAPTCVWCVSVCEFEYTCMCILNQ